MSGQLCLRWNNHSTAFTKLLSQIHLEDTYSDGTILCQGKFYPVHRFVLSTCSDYFEEMFRQCIRLNNKHPFIIVKDIHPDQMEALLNYMYKGEVNVPQEMLPELIKAAEAFKIRGLAVPDEEPTSKASRKRASASSPPSIAKRSRRHDEKQSDKSDTSTTDIDRSNNWDKQHSDSPVPSTSSIQAKAEEIFITEPNTSTTIKTEPLETEEENPVSEKSPEEENSVKPEPDFEVYSGDESNYQAFDYEPPHNFDGQEQESVSWDNSQAFEGEDDPTNRLRPRKKINQGGIKKTKESIHKRNYPCKNPGCNYVTKSHKQFLIHIEKHSEEKPFRCPQCPHRCAHYSFLINHIKEVHLVDDNKALNCNIKGCYFETNHQHQLHKHILKQHKGNKERMFILHDRYNY